MVSLAALKNFNRPARLKTHKTYGNDFKSLANTAYAATANIEEADMRNEEINPAALGAETAQKLDDALFALTQLGTDFQKAVEAAMPDIVKKTCKAIEDDTVEGVLDIDPHAIRQEIADNVVIAVAHRLGL